jgi:SAM-dependent methyltransferase
MDRLLAATAAAEDRHFWFLAMRRFARGMLDRALAEQRAARTPMRIIDCGAGTGRNLDWLADYGWAMGVELSPAGIAVARAHGRRVVRGTVAALPVPDGSMSLATSFDVIYSLDDAVERQAFAEMRRVVAPGGLVLINAAALDILRGSHSALAHEVRRYTRARLRDRLAAAGFDVIEMSYTHAATLPLTLSVRLLQRARGERDTAAETEMAVPAAPVNAMLNGILAVEAAALRWVRMPAGSSLMATARRI